MSRIHLIGSCRLRIAPPEPHIVTRYQNTIHAASHMLQLVQLSRGELQLPAQPALNAIFDHLVPPGCPDVEERNRTVLRQHAIDLPQADVIVVELSGIRNFLYRNWHLHWRYLPEQIQPCDVFNDDVATLTGKLKLLIQELSPIPVLFVGYQNIAGVVNRAIILEALQATGAPFIDPTVFVTQHGEAATMADYFHYTPLMYDLMGAELLRRIAELLPAS